MRVDHRWLVLPLFIVVCAARTGDWKTACPNCLTRIATYFDAPAVPDMVKVDK